MSPSTSDVPTFTARSACTALLVVGLVAAPAVAASHGKQRVLHSHSSDLVAAVVATGHLPSTYSCTTASADSAELARTTSSTSAHILALTNEAVAAEKTGNMTRYNQLESVASGAASTGTAVGVTFSLIHKDCPVEASVSPR